MSRNHSDERIRNFDGFVNGLAVLVTISLIGAGYISAVVSFIGVA